MMLRQLGLYAQELETGPFTFLLSHSVPVAYKDSRTTLAYRTDAWYSKATSAHLNKWLKGVRHAIVPHDLIVDAFQGVSIYTERPSVVR